MVRTRTRAFALQRLAALRLPSKLLSPGGTCRRLSSLPPPPICDADLRRVKILSRGWSSCSSSGSPQSPGFAYQLREISGEVGAWGVLAPWDSKLSLLGFSGFLPNRQIKLSGRVCSLALGFA